jgi:hypothetical protein
VTGAAGAEEAGPPAREIGWWRPVLALALLMFIPATLLQLVIPLDQTFMLVAPLIAVSAVAGWRAGGRWPLAFLWSGIAVLVFWQGGRGAGAFTLLSHGWAFVLAASYGAMLMAPVGGSFLPKALASLALALGISGLLVMFSPEGLAGVVTAVTGEFGERSELAMTAWREVTSRQEWQELLRESPTTARIFSDEAVATRTAQLRELGGRLAPAMLALESLAAMAVAWSFYHRVGRARLGPPLSRLQDLRFDDSLVWGVVAGLVLVVLPSSGVTRVIGFNLLLFFGALYAIRGMGVLVWFLSPRRWMMVFLIIFSLVFWKVVGSVAAAVGLGDTWYDWRRDKTSRQRSQRSE